MLTTAVFLLLAPLGGLMLLHRRHRAREAVARHLTAKPSAAPREASP